MDLRKDTIRTLLGYANKRYLTREFFFEIFGMKNIPSRVIFESPPAVQEVQKDDEIIKKCLITSKLYENNHNVGV